MTKEFNAPECKCESVVVYLDRAEVSRSLKVELTAGENEVVIKELSACIDKDSIRLVRHFFSSALFFKYMVLLKPIFFTF